MIKKIIQKLSMGKVAVNVSWIVFQNIFTMLISLVSTSIVARHYGPDGYGIINLALSFVSLFSFIAICGTNHIIINDLSEKKYDTNVVLGTNFTVRIILSIISLLISQIFALIIYDNFVINIIIFLFNINVVLNCSDIISYYAQSKIKNKFISISKMITSIILMFLKLLCVLLNLSIIYLVLTFLIENVIYGILLFYFYKRENSVIKWKFNRKYAKELLKRGKYFALSSLMVTIYLRVDQVMIGTIFNDKTHVGIYSAAVKIAELWTFVPVALITSYKPIITSNKLTSQEIYKKNLQKLYNLTSLLCFIFIVGIIIFGKLGIYVIYGKNYLEAYPSLVILIFGTWFGILGNIHYIYMACERKEKYSLYYSFVGCIVNIILNSILIPKFGIIGAAMATLASQLCSNIIVFLFIRNIRIISIMLLKSLNPICGINELKGAKLGGYSMEKPQK